MLTLTTRIIYKGNIVFDDNEMAICRSKKDQLIAFAGAVLLLLSVSMNGLAYFQSGIKKGLFILIPLLSISIVYFLFTFIPLIKTLRFKERWYDYSSIAKVTVKEKRGWVFLEFSFTDGTNQKVSTPSDRYFVQFLETLRKNGVNVEKVASTK